MELHKALQHIIQTEGQDILKETRLVNILDDFNAYQDIPASKYILRAIIAEGYTTKLLALGKWNNNAEVLSQKFSAITGFIPESVSIIFQSIAFGLDWMNEFPSVQIVSSTNRSKSNSFQNRKQFKGLSKAEQEKLLSGLIQIEPYIESNYNLIVKANVSISYSTLYINVEATGKLEQNNLTLLIAIYNKNGELKDYKRAFNFDMRPSVSPFCCSRIYFDGFLSSKGDRCVDFDISKIVIYAQN